MNLSELRKDFLTMTDEERMEKLLGIRADRAVSKTAITKRKAVEKKKTSSMTKLFAGLTDEQKAAILEDLT